MDTYSDDMQALAHQQECEHQRWMAEMGMPSSDGREIESYGDKHGV